MFVCCALVSVCLLDFAELQEIEEKIIPRNVDTLMTDELPKIKRPFCNAFTGCGKKRSFYGKLPDSQYYDRKEDMRPFYKALAKAASGPMSKSLDGYRVPVIVPDYDSSYYDQKPSYRNRLQS